MSGIDILAMVSLVTTIVVNLLFGAVVIARTYRKHYGWYFALTILGIVAWAWGDMLLLLSDNTKVIDIGAQLFYIGPMVIPVCIWFFALSFPGDNKLTKWPLIVAGSVFSVFSLIFLTNLDFFITKIETNGYTNAPVPHLPGFFLYALYFSFFFMLTYITFYMKIRRLRGVSKTQLVYTFLGAMLASVPALFTNLTMPMAGNTRIIWLGPLFTLIFAATVTLAIVRHKLFDIQPVIVRTLGYMVTIVTVASLYGFFIFGAILLISDVRLTLPVQIALAISTGIATLLFQSIKTSVDKLTNRLFYRDAYDPQLFFDEYNKALVSTIDLNVLLKRTTSIVVKHIKSEYSYVGIKGVGGGYRLIGNNKTVELTQTEIRELHQSILHVRSLTIMVEDLSLEQAHLQRLLMDNNIAVIVRLTSEYHKTKEDIGFLALGPKKSGNQYSRNDVQVIDSVANELIIALQNALRFEEIERFNETLQQKIQDATRQLRESNKKLKQLNESKDDFIGMASHQLRTPLTSIKGYISLVMDGDAGPITDMQHKLLKQAFSSSQKMVYLIADLLNVSRLKTGKFVIERKPTNLAKMLDDEMAQLREEATSRGLELTYEAPTKFPVLPLDETKTRQVVMNFLDNAIYYTPTGGHIRAELKDLEHSIEFRVVDDGIGVPKSERHHLFTKFYRAKNAQRARPDGTGLGLYMAQKVVLAQGGAVIFDSEEGKGSTFGFTFPKDMPTEDVSLPIQAHD